MMVAAVPSKPPIAPVFMALTLSTSRSSSSEEEGDEENGGDLQMEAEKQTSGQQPSDSSSNSSTTEGAAPPSPIDDNPVANADAEGLLEAINHELTNAGKSPIRLECLFLPETSGLTKAQWTEKEEEIRVALRGRSVGEGQDEVVDLWQLRELALSPGGLLSPELRKSAWPKLLACHDKLFRRDPTFGRADGSSTGISIDAPELVEPAGLDLQQLAHNVGKTIWCVEDHIHAGKALRKHQEHRRLGKTESAEKAATDQSSPKGLGTSSSASVASSTAKRRKVTFAPVCSVATPSQSPRGSPTASNHSGSTSTAGADNRGPPLSIMTTVATKDATHDVVDASESSITGVGDDDDDDAAPSGIRTPNSHSSEQHQGDGSLNNSMVSVETCSTHTSWSQSTRVVRWRKASPGEQKILYNIILSLFRAQPQDNDYFEDDNYHFYRGLQDLAALLMINMESPSLTSLVLAKLAESHLRDALRDAQHGFNMLQLAVTHAFMPLLESFDKDLHGLLRERGIKLPSFCRQWIACWFTQDIPNAQVASRFVDAFLVGHPLLPMYVSVAVLTEHKKEIGTFVEKSSACAGGSPGGAISALHDYLRALPLRAFHGDENFKARMEKAELVIATAMSYMQRLPPGKALSLVLEGTTDPGARAMCPAIAMLAPNCPDWCLRGVAPSDFSMIQKKVATETLLGPVAATDNSVLDCDAVNTLYSTAACAAGVSRRVASTVQKRHLLSKTRRLALLIASLLLGIFALRFREQPQSELGFNQAVRVESVTPHTSTLAGEEQLYANAQITRSVDAKPTKTQKKRRTYRNQFSAPVSEQAPLMLPAVPGQLLLGATSTSFVSPSLVTARQLVFGVAHFAKSSAKSPQAIASSQLRLAKRYIGLAPKTKVQVAIPVAARPVATHQQLMALPSRANNLTRKCPIRTVLNALRRQWQRLSRWHQRLMRIFAKTK